MKAHKLLLNVNAQELLHGISLTIQSVQVGLGGQESLELNWASKPPSLTLTPRHNRVQQGVSTNRIA